MARRKRHQNTPVPKDENKGKSKSESEGESEGENKSEGEGKRSHRPMWVASLPILALVILAIWLMRGLVLPVPQGDASGFNVLLITLDTTRTDYLGCYGHPGKHTPNIDRLATEGTMFAQCTSSAPSTLPSHASIMTAVHPYVHGTRHNVGYRLSEANRTLAEALQEADYATGAFAAAFVVNRGMGLDQGFDTYDDAGMRNERRGNEVCDAAIRWLRDHAGERFFLWTHFFDPHHPYEPPEPYRSRYPNPYQGEIAFTDDQIGRLLDELRRLELEDKTLIVVTADHGEGLGQHGEPGHLYFLYDTTLSVPLVFHVPGQIPAGQRIETQVRTIDIAPTILALVGVAPFSDVQGVNLLPLILRQTDDLELPAYSETLGGKYALGTSMLRSLRSQGWKYIHAPRPELYDLRSDPGETANQATDKPERLAEMREQLRESIATSPQRVGLDGSQLKLNAEALARLANLGYVGQATDSSSTPENELEWFEPVGDDPKDHAEAFVTLDRAIRALENRELKQAERLYRDLVAAFPKVVDLRQKLARSIFWQGNVDEPIAIYRQLVNSHPDNAVVRYGYGKLLDHAGRLTEAIEQFAAATGIDPEYPEACHDLAIALRADGRRSEAIDYFRQALRARPTYVRARVNLAMDLMVLDQYKEAIDHFRQALRVKPEDPIVHFSLGRALLQAGKREEAVRSFEEAIRLKPDFAPAREALSQLQK